MLMHLYGICMWTAACIHEAAADSEFPQTTTEYDVKR